MSAPHLVFHTMLCDLLGIDYPILQSGMGGIAGPDLAATVSNAGGLGILAGFLLTADQLRDAIRAIRRQTDKPFGVNLLLPPEVHPPMRSADLSDQMVQLILAQRGYQSNLTVIERVKDAYQSALQIGK